jgi:NitT/TauT family transport system permease protein
MPQPGLISWKRPIPYTARLPTVWDLMAFGLVFGGVVAIWIVFRQIGQPIATVEHVDQSLDPRLLPFYALRTTLRMLAALVASFVFSVIYASVAAKSRRAEIVMIPILDVLQSIPILGYISFTVTFFILLFPGTVLGPELACVFAIFTGQAWNMTFSLYQSLRTIPADLDEVSKAFHFNAWQRFLRLELPFAMPGLIWNMMMSMSGGWFFIVAAESVKVGDTQFALPGIGSYLAAAIDQRNLGAVGWTILTMSIVILLYDQLMFRPLVAWADKFRFDTAAGAATAAESWLLTRLKQARWTMSLRRMFARLLSQTLKIHLNLPIAAISPQLSGNRVSRVIDVVWYVLIGAVALYGGLLVEHELASKLDWSDVGHAALLGFYTLLRVATLIALATVIWVPIGVYIGLKPRLAEFMQPVAQFMAAFPANLTFPIAVIGVLHFHLNPDIWLSPLIILGTQWYILFNVIAGTTAFPSDLRETATSFHIKGRLWWVKVMLPGIMPYYITGALTATGGAWNASIVSEAVSWGDRHVTAHGLGAYIAQMTDAADYPRIILGIGVMSLYVVMFNRALWRPLYRLSERRFKLA